MKKINIFISFLMILILTGCDKVLNFPYEKELLDQNVYFSSFNEAPKTLDPARAYSVEEALFIAQIYEPPLQYHYLKRPYTLIPLTTTTLPTVSYYDAKGHKLKSPNDIKQIAVTYYDITIKPGIYYQPHPAFARDRNGHYVYHTLSEKEILAKKDLFKDFPQQATRELTAEDYVYEIKRLADPKVQSPIFGLMAHFILGLPELRDHLKAIPRAEGQWLDLRAIPLKGVQIIDCYHYQIKVQGYYPQFIYWLAMPFFASIPWEVDRFYAQLGMEKRNFSFDWYPVGTGPYQLIENNPNRRMVLAKNPNFHPEFYPREGEVGDAQKGYLRLTGQRLPFVDRFIFSLEKEFIPRWVKFLQGYYDTSAISNDSYDQAIQLDSKGVPQLSEEMQQKNIQLHTSVVANIFYYGFNMLDPVVGGYSESARKLRQAITIALDNEEFISIFLNGRGIPAQTLIPPGIFGHVSGQEGINPYIYDWKKNKPKRKSIAEAKRLLAEAGYPKGIDPKTKRSLVLHYDVPVTNGPDDKDRLDWTRKQLAKLGIHLNIRATLYNRFQQKMRTGQAQIFLWGWNADYPDPENFLFLLYGANGKVKYDGENAANYVNPEYDALFRQMKSMNNTPERLAVIKKMVTIVQHDNPWIFAFYPENFSLSHQWMSRVKSGEVVNNLLKYIAIDSKLRKQKIMEWNHPRWDIILGILIIVSTVILLAIILIGKKQKNDAHASKKA